MPETMPRTPDDAIMMRSSVKESTGLLLVPVDKRRHVDRFDVLKVVMTT
jgi:hypothetical protein